MITSTQLQQLLDNINAINELTLAKGFSNIRIFKPLVQSEANNLHFLVKIENKEVSLFDKARLKQGLRDLLVYEDIIVLTENELNEEGQQTIMGKQVALQLGNKQALVDFFQKELNISPNLNTDMQQPAVSMDENQFRIQFPKPSLALNGKELEDYVDTNLERAKQNLLQLVTAKQFTKA